MKHGIIKRYFTALLVICLIAAVPLSASASSDWQTPYNSVLNYISGGTPSFGSIGGEWQVFTIARSERLPLGDEYFTSYYNRIEQYVASVGSAVLNRNKATENSRLVIALTAIGRDARSVAGFDIVEPLTDQSFVKKQGPTGAAFALIALSRYGEESTRNDYVNFLLNTERPGGGWSLGTNADPDVTSMVINALAPYPQAAEAVERGVNKLSELQADNGGFETMGSATSESCSQAVTALSTMRVDADSDPRFVKNGVSALSALLEYFTGTGFAHVPNGLTNGMASEQAAYALCAYWRMKTGKNALFDMSDVQPVGGETPKPTSTPKPTPTPKPMPTPKPTPSPEPVYTQSPTGTPKPTATPTVTPAPTSAPSAENTAVPTGISAPTDMPETAFPTSSQDTTPTPEATLKTELLTQMPTQAPEASAPAPASAAPSETAEAAAPGQNTEGSAFPTVPVIIAAAAVTAFIAVFCVLRRKNK